MKAEIKVVCSGWSHSKWASGFFPEDIPSDWRLDFYSNEFSALFLDAEQNLEQDFYLNLEESEPDELVLLVADTLLEKNTALDDWQKNCQDEPVRLISLSEFETVAEFETFVEIELRDEFETLMMALPMDSEAGSSAEPELFYYYRCDKEMSPKALRALAEFLLSQADARFPKSDVTIWLIFSNSPYTVVNCQNLEMLSHML